MTGRRESPEVRRLRELAELRRQQVVGLVFELGRVAVLTGVEVSLNPPLPSAALCARVWRELEPLAEAA